MDAAVYYPILRAKAGEIEALGYLNPQTKTGIRPLLTVPAPRPGREMRLDATLSEIIKSLATTWGVQHRLYLDLPSFRPEWTAHGMPAVEFLFACARQKYLKAIPVTGPQILRGAEYLNSVSRIAAHDGRGAAIRLHHEDIASVRTLRARLVETLQTLELVPNLIDLLLDLEAIERIPTPDGDLEQALLSLLSRAVEVASEWPFRNVIVGASCLPEKVDKKFERNAKKVFRMEARLWRSLTAVTNRASLPFADYGVIYPHDGDASGGANPPARIRFADAEHYWLYRAPRKQYRALAGAVAQSTEFRTAVDSWGQMAIARCAAGCGPVGNATKWVAWDTNRHIETTTAIITRLLVSRGRLPESASAEREHEPWMQTVMDPLLPP